jgi:predicted Na+-dependent transporter
MFFGRANRFGLRASNVFFTGDHRPCASENRFVPCAMHVLVWAEDEMWPREGRTEATRKWKTCCVEVIIQFVLFSLLVFHICYNFVVLCQKVTRIS